MQALDELVARWRKNPDPDATLALCAHLGTTRQSELLREVGNTAEAWHRDNLSVMLSVGRMYLDAGLLAEAQASFIQAGKLAPTEREVYRFLGEVLLRRGDAVRSEKALARAIKLGDDTAATRLWHERSVVYCALQTRKGLTAVADEVARTAPRQPSIPAPTLSPFQRDQPVAARGGTRRSRPPTAGSRSLGSRRAPAPGGPRRRASAPPAAATAAAAKSAPLETLLMGRTPVPARPFDAPLHPPSPFVPAQSNSPGPRPRERPPESSRQTSAARSAAGAAVTPQAPRHAKPAVPTGAVKPFFPLEAPTAPDKPSDPEPVTSDPFGGTFAEEPSRARSPSPAPPSPLPKAVEDATLIDNEGAGADREAGEQREANASPEAVLLALARVGLYEADSAVVPAWEASVRSAPRRLWVLGGALLLALGVGAGGYHYATELRSERLARAQELSTRLAGLLDGMSRADLRASEADFQRLFELDSRGREPALLWLKNRVSHVLLSDEPASGIESALQRARTVGIEESRIAFGRLASALAARDLPGAGQIIAEWDERASGDALYQLLAGVVFERAGNPDALERYTRATALQPDLKLAHLLAARLALIQLGPAEAKARLELAYGRLGQGPAAEVLRGLEWAASISDAPAPPLPAADSLADTPLLLRTTASAVEAVKAQREARIEDATQAFRRALGPDTTPAMAAWIGYQALEAGDVEIARAAALKAMELSALHKRSQALAARIALAEGRLEAAREAVRGLDPSSRDALLIEAVSAYENLQAAATLRLLGTLPTDATAEATFLALRESERAISGQTRWQPRVLDQLKSQSQIWGAVLAFDVALDNGQLEFAEALATARGWKGEMASLAARLMRLRRYQGQLESALSLAPVVLDSKQLGPRGVTEVVVTFVEAGRVAAATTTLAGASDAAGELNPWLQALVDSAGGRQTAAAKRLAELKLPTRSEPLLLQVMALRALAATKDRRAKAHLAQLRRRFPNHPDVQALEKQLSPRK
jgi:hypothetical protein